MFDIANLCGEYFAAVDADPQAQEKQTDEIKKRYSEYFGI